MRGEEVVGGIVIGVDVYVDQLGDRMRLLVEQPSFECACDELRAGDCRILSGSHVVLYRIDCDVVVVVVRVLHEKIDFDAWF